MTEAQALEDEEDLQGAVDKLVELNKRFGSKDNADKKLEVLEKIFTLYRDLAEKVQEEDAA